MKRLGVVLACSLAWGGVAWGQAPGGKPVKAAKKATTSIADLEASIAALKTQVEALSMGAGDAAAARSAVTELETRVIALASEIDELKRTAQTAPESRQVIDGLAERVTALEHELDEVRATAALPGPPAPDPDVTPAPSGGGGGYDDGYVLATGRFGLKLNGYVRARYVMDYSGEAEEVVANGFSVHRARLSASGHAWKPALTWKVQFELTDPAAPLRDGYLDYKLRPELALRGGQFRVPLMRQFLTPITELVFADRSLTTSVNAPTRDVGVGASGKAVGKKLSYWLAITNGAGQNAVNDNKDLRFTGRVAVAPMGEIPLEEGDLGKSDRARVELSAAAMYDLTPNDDVNGDGNKDNAQVIALNVGLVARWKGLSLEGEYLARMEKEGGGRKELVKQGGYAQLSALVWKHLVLGARAGALQPTMLGKALSARVDLAEKRWEGTFVVLWNSPDPVKLQAEYSLLQDEFVVGSDKVLHRALAQAQIAF